MLNFHAVSLSSLQNKGLEHQLQTYMAMLAEEKERASKHIETVEIRMREMQVREHFSTCDVIRLMICNSKHEYMVCVSSAGRARDEDARAEHSARVASLAQDGNRQLPVADGGRGAQVRHVFFAEHTCSL